ncbi:MOLPALP family lipoprotein [Mesoplasma melaleucae]|uniref:MOLPALP family lipoprotein n=1 Tax=Mesoplasma melaleucae TaxID=81459 RepID=A0A2K8NVH7_9MOLU|nr:MOLPALP family lipoprotein [Mesoplasma melaleucae]ATZ17842.1 MOLPALP family lipoprotein [Mesoplasma melaleucae]
MKKMLLSLTAVSMIASTTVTLGCTYTAKARSEFAKSIQKIINVANVSAEAQILTSSNKAEQDKIVVQDYKNNSRKINGVEYSSSNANVDYSYLINNFSGLKASAFLPKSDLVNSTVNEGIDDNVKMDRYLFKNYGKNWVNNITSSAIKNDEIYKGTKTGSSSITKTAGIASSLLGMVFGSDFSTAEAGFLNDNIATLLNQVPDATKESIATTIDGIADKIKTLPDLSRVLVNPLNAYVGSTRYEAFTKISDTFWKAILNKNGTETKADGEVGKTISTVGSALQYVFTLVWYVQEFADLTDKTITSEDLTDVLTEKVTTDDVKNYDQININKLFKVLNNFLDPGRDIQKAKNFVIILLGIPAERGDFKPKTNIIFDSLFNVLAGKETTGNTLSASSRSTNIFGLNIEQIIKFLMGLINSNNTLPKEVIKEIYRLIDVLKEILADEDKSIYTILKVLLNEVLFKPLTEDGKSILLIGDVLYFVADSINKKAGKVVIDAEPFKLIGSIASVPNPFGALNNGGLLKSIFQSVNYFTKKDIIGEAVIQNFKDLSSIFNTKMDIIFTQMLNVDYDNNLQFLYGLKDWTIASIFKAIGNQFNEAKYESNEYFFDLGAVRTILLSLLNKSFEQITIIDEENKEEVLEEPNNLFATLKVVAAAVRNKTVKFNDVEVKDSKSIVNVLGLDPKNSSKFIDGSIFDAIAQAYGHGVILKDAEKNETRVEMPEKGENTIRLISLLFKGILWMTNVSEKKYYDDQFGHFVDQNNWTSNILSYTNFDKIHEEANIKYNLIYQNKKYKIKEVYQVTLIREKTPENEWLGNKYFAVSSIIRK